MALTNDDLKAIKELLNPVNERLDVAVSERDIRRDIHELKDEMETIIEIIKQNELIPI